MDGDGTKRVSDVGWSGCDDGRTGRLEKEVWRRAGGGGECESEMPDARGCRG